MAKSATRQRADTIYGVGDGGFSEKNFSTADNNKLDNIEVSATADQTKADIEALGIAASSITGALPAIDASLLTNLPTSGEFVSITEGANTGFGTSYRADNPANYGDIGNNARDLSYNPWASTTHGATGENSTALGYYTTASGKDSTASGYSTRAVGLSATAMGYATHASGSLSTAMGSSTEASGSSSTAMGSSTTASGSSATAMGSSTLASGTSSMAVGASTTASGINSMALGQGANATGDIAVATGYITVASGLHSTAIGSNTEASGDYSTAMGQLTVASFPNSTAMGNATEASGSYSTAMGQASSASGTTATAMGASTEASGTNSTAMGSSTEASGSSATAMGASTIASGDYSTALGSSTIASGYNSVAMGASSTASGAHAVTVGAFSTASGDRSTAMGHVTTASADFSATMGNTTTAGGIYSTVMGYNGGVGTTSGTLLGVAYGASSPGDITAATTDTDLVFKVHNTGLTTWLNGTSDDANTAFGWGDHAAAGYGTGSGNTSEFVATGTLPNGTPVVLNNDGTVTAVKTEATTTPMSIPAGTDYTFNAGATNFVSSAFVDSTTGRFVTVYRDTSSSGKAIVGTVSGTSITFGSEYTFNAGDSVDISLSVDPHNAGKFVVSYQDVANSQYGTMIIGNISGTVVTFGSEYVFNSAITLDTSIAFDPITVDKLMVVFSDGGDAYRGSIMIGLITGTTVAFGSKYYFSNSSEGIYDLSVIFDPNTVNVCVVTYRDVVNGGGGKSSVGIISGTTISMSGKMTFNSSGSYNITSAFDPNNAKFFVVAYRNTSDGSFTAIVGEVSAASNMVYWGTPVVFELNETTTEMSIAFDPSSSGKVLISARENTGHGVLYIGQLTGRAIVFDPQEKFSTNNVSESSLAFDPRGDGKFITSYMDFSNSSNGMVIVSNLTFTGPATNLTSTNFVGTSTEAYTDGQTSTIMLQGGLSTNQTGLVANSTYYVQEDGTLATTADTISVIAGRALSSTSLQLTTGGVATGGVATHFHSVFQTVTSGEATTNVSATVDYTFSELTDAKHYVVFLNRNLLRPDEYSVSGTTVTIVIGILAENDEIEVTGFSS